MSDAIKNAATSGSQELPFVFGVSEFTTMPWTFEEDVERYVALGVGAIELCEQKLDDDRFDEQMALLARSGLNVSAVQPLVRTFFSSRMQPEPEGLKARTARLRKSIDRLAPFTRGAPFIVNTGAPLQGNIAEAKGIVARQLEDIALVAREHGVRLALEPLNPSAMNVETAVWTVAQAMDIIDDVGDDQVGLCLDLWNVWQEEEVEESIARAGNRIFALQISDWRTPHSFADRLVPGDGIIPLSRLLRATYAAGYEGVCSLEVFSQGVANSIYNDDLEAVIIRSRDALLDLWRK